MSRSGHVPFWLDFIFARMLSGFWSVGRCMPETKPGLLLQGSCDHGQVTGMVGVKCWCCWLKGMAFHLFFVILVPLPWAAQDFFDCPNPWGFLTFDIRRVIDLDNQEAKAVTRRWIVEPLITYKPVLRQAVGNHWNLVGVGNFSQEYYLVCSLHIAGKPYHEEGPFFFNLFNLSHQLPGQIVQAVIQINHDLSITLSGGDQTVSCPKAEIDKTGLDDL